MTEPLTLAQRLRALVIMDEVMSDNPLGREAADALDAKDATIASLRDANKALTAEKDKWREAFSGMHRQTMTAEAKLAKVEADARARARAERDGLAFIVNARKKHVDAVAAYNARRELLKTVPLGCGNLDIEFRAFSDAQSEFIATAQTVADSFLASSKEPSR